LVAFCNNLHGLLDSSLLDSWTPGALNLKSSGAPNESQLLSGLTKHATLRPRNVGVKRVRVALPLPLAPLCLCHHSCHHPLVLHYSSCFSHDMILSCIAQYHHETFFFKRRSFATSRKTSYVSAAVALDHHEIFRVWLTQEGWPSASGPELLSNMGRL